MSIRVFAPAKINLTLEVGALKANGRHPLQSVVAFADVGDWVEAAEAGELSLAIDGPFAAGLSVEQDNLVLRAARALAEAAGIGAPGAALRLTKNLPVASGIGGGSSDAAAALKALNRLWSLGLSEQRLMQIGAGLGGDVPVCVFARSAYMTGEGETVAPLALAPLNAVLVNPGVAVSTGAVFQCFDALNGGEALASSPAPDWRSFQDVCAGIAARGNQLAAPARVIAPAIGRVEAALVADAASRSVSLSGSGATVFALTETKPAAEAMAERIRAGFPDWWVAPTSLALDAPFEPR
ncbi:MAG: 4-(cytidine 5'-diphospho)-2-C-methyl-D-erythritol kinase [Hyphomonadaceae bacterium]|nr:4-(cytidine 5'-diphospho)-2-C-methyl-D-erythritol kinase [Hyphomonadaceae bacterium]